jgi:hypothetical protein
MLEGEAMDSTNKAELNSNKHLPRDNLIIEGEAMDLANKADLNSNKHLPWENLKISNNNKIQ